MLIEDLMGSLMVTVLCVKQKQEGATTIGFCVRLLSIVRKMSQRMLAILETYASEMSMDKYILLNDHEKMFPWYNEEVELDNIS